MILILKHSVVLAMVKFLVNPFLMLNLMALTILIIFLMVQQKLLLSNIKQMQKQKKKQLLLIIMLYLLVQKMQMQKLEIKNNN